MKGGNWDHCLFLQTGGGGGAWGRGGGGDKGPLVGGAEGKEKKKLTPHEEGVTGKKGL